MTILANLGPLPHNIITRKRDLIHLRNVSKLVQGSLYAIIELLIGAKSITLYLI